ncbi:DUF5655 domain-containing protein [Paenibacillus sp. MBLB4367]|uniref:DUF5655 domain-containing protein n=1 Tax=Paenibacillus sp. MBLB4367 TaxID=3384767 RepID=UPI003907F6F6
MDFDSYNQAMANSMKERTGKTVEEWLELLKDAPLPEKPSEKKKWLKEHYGLGQNSAMMLLGLISGVNEYADGDKLVDALFQKENEELRMLYDRVAKHISAIGSDISIQPRKTYIPFYRKKQFLMIKPHKGVLNIGLALPETLEYAHLDSAKGLGGNERITRKIVAEPKGDLDDAAMRLIRAAYECNG